MRKLITQFSGVLITFLMLAAYGNPAHAQGPRPFITKWSLPDEGELKVDFTGALIYEIENLADGTKINGEVNHYLKVPLPAGEYTLSVVSKPSDYGSNGPLRQFTMRTSPYLTEVVQWGDTPWWSFEEAFYVQKNIAFTATDTPNLSSTTSMKRAFAYTNFETIGNISSWDFSKVRDMSEMFFAASFNQDISDWDVSNVMNMSSMFESAASFNQDISDWDVSNVMNMSSMFRSAASFNQDISNWNVSSVENMMYMLFSAYTFNQDISNWDVSNVKHMFGMFDYAYSFNQNLANWKLNSLDFDEVNILSASISFDFSGMSCINLSKTINGWAANPDIASDVSIYLKDMSYNPEAEANLQDLMDNKNWSVWDGKVGNCYQIPGHYEDDFVTLWKFDQPKTTVTIPLKGSYEYLIHSITYDQDIITATNTNDLTYEFIEGDYLLYVYPLALPGEDLFHAIQFHNDESSGKEYIYGVVQWGKRTEWSTLEGAFYGCENMKISAGDIPNFSNVISMKDAFNGTAIDKIDNISNWDVSNVSTMLRAFANTPNLKNPYLHKWNVESVEDMAFMFENSSFSGHIYMYLSDGNSNHWKTSSLKSINGMFKDATLFYSNVNILDVSQVSDFSQVFEGAVRFDNYLDQWDMHNATNLSRMFAGAEVFNRDISGWDVSNMVYVSETFKGAKRFNSDISNWDVRKVENASGVFLGANSFNQDLGDWNLKSLKSFSSNDNDFSFGKGMSCENYSKTLRGWANNPETPSNIRLDVDNLEYSLDVRSDRKTLTASKNWTITGDRQGDCTIGTPTGIENDIFGKGISLYPNPAVNEFYVSGLSGREVLMLYDLNGKLLQSKVAANELERMGINRLSSGLYLLKVTSDKGESVTLKIIK